MQRQQVPLLRSFRTLAVVAVFGMAAPALASGPAPTGDLHGVVTGRSDGLGMPSVSVTLRLVPCCSPRASDDAPWVEVRNTDTEGVFRFDDIPAGVYAIEARLDGRQWSSDPILVVPGTRVHEHIVLGDAPATPSQS
jgi:hypothetical protein